MTLYEENVLAVVRWCWTRGYRLPADLRAVPPELHGYSRCVLLDAMERLAKIPPRRSGRRVRRARPVAPAERVSPRTLGRQLLRWMVSQGLDHGRACQLAGISRDELRTLIAGRRVCQATERRVVWALMGGENRA